MPSELEREMFAALEDLVPRFVKCCVTFGADQEYAEMGVEKHRAVIVKAKAERAL